MILKFKNYFYTIWYLKAEQIIFQIWRKLKPVTIRECEISSQIIAVSNIRFFQVSYCDYDMFNKRILVFDQEYDFDTFPKYDTKLKARDYLVDFSFFYLEFLISRNSNADFVEFFLKSFLSKRFDHPYILHPYTASKRIPVYLNLLSNYQQNSEIISLTKTLLNLDVAFLKNNIEYHIGANHKLTNLCSLCIASYIIKDKELLKYRTLYEQEFLNQFSNGSHYERSFSYCKQMLYEFCLVAQLEKKYFLKNKSLMIKVLNQLVIKNTAGCINFGDNIDEQCCALDWLVEFFEKNYKIKVKHDTNSIFMQTSDRYVCYHSKALNCSIDAGYPTPSHQPGHANDSTGAIVASFNGYEIISSSGTSTYNRSTQRELERSRFAYSKPVSEGTSQDVWSSFRVAKRRIPKLKFLNHNVVELNVYTSAGMFSRQVKVSERDILEVTDRFERNGIHQTQFILSEGIEVCLVNAHRLILKGSHCNVEVIVSDGTEILLGKIDIGVRYRQLRCATVLTFETKKTEIWTNWRLM